MKRRFMFVGLALLLALLMLVGCSSSIETLKVEQPTTRSVVILSAGRSWTTDYDMAYQIIFQLDKKVGVESYYSVAEKRTLRTTVFLTEPAVISVRKYAASGSSKLSIVEVLVADVGE